MRVEAPPQKIRSQAFVNGETLTEAEIAAMNKLQGAIDDGRLVRIGDAVVDRRIHRNTSRVLRDLPPEQLGSAIILGEHTSIQKLKEPRESKLHIGSGTVVVNSSIEGALVTGSAVIESRVRRGATINSRVQNSRLFDSRLESARVNRIGAENGTQIYDAIVAHGTIFDSAIDEGSTVHHSHVRNSVVTASGLRYVVVTDSQIHNTPELSGTIHRSKKIDGTSIREGRVEFQRNQRPLSPSAA